jgi:hypothetical protein
MKKKAQVLRRRVVTMQPNSYQPTKAEAEEVIVLRRKGGSAPTAQDLARAVVQPVEVTYLEKPKRTGDSP